MKKLTKPYQDFKRVRLPFLLPNISNLPHPSFPPALTPHPTHFIVPQFAIQTRPELRRNNPKDPENVRLHPTHDISRDGAVRPWWWCAAEGLRARVEAQSSHLRSLRSACEIAKFGVSGVVTASVSVAWEHLCFVGFL